MSIYRAFISADLYRRLERYRVTEAEMPEEYRIGHRPLRDDWTLLQDTPRIDGYRRVPLPFKIDGPHHQEWTLWDFKYPLAPGHEIVMRDYRTATGLYSLPHVLVDVGDYGLCKYAAFIDGEWRHVHTKFTKKILGRRFSAYFCLHQDLHVSPPDEHGKTRSDLGAWIEPPTASFVKEI